jgi:hypothetical protein
MEVVVVKLPCPLETLEVAVVEPVAQYEEMTVAEWKVLAELSSCR